MCLWDSYTHTLYQTMFSCILPPYSILDVKNSYRIPDFLVSRNFISGAVRAFSRLNSPIYIPWLNYSNPYSSQRHIPIYHIYGSTHLILRWEVTPNFKARFTSSLISSSRFHYFIFLTLEFHGLTPFNTRFTSIRLVRRILIIAPGVPRMLGVSTEVDYLCVFCSLSSSFFLFFSSFFLSFFLSFYIFSSRSLRAEMNPERVGYQRNK